MRYTQKHIDRMIAVIRKDGIKVRQIQEHPILSKSNCRAINQSITLGVKGPKWYVLSSLAHEYGHCLTVRNGVDGLRFGTALFYELGIVRTKEDGKELIREEHTAWKLGYAAMRANDIGVDSDLLAHRDVLVQSHVQWINYLLSKSRIRVAAAINR